MDYKYKVIGNNVQEAVDKLIGYGFVFAYNNKDEIISPWEEEKLNNVIENLGLNISIEFLESRL